MVRNTHVLGAALLAALLPFTAVHAGDSPLATTISLQGRLRQGNQPVTGPADLLFRLYDAPGPFADQVGPELSATGFNGFDDSGIFVIDLDFGAGVFNGARRWLEVEVDGETLAPRQEVLPAPYALFAVNGGGAPPGGASWDFRADEISTMATAVGIGTNAPQSLLHLSSETGIDLILDGDTNNAGGEDQNPRILLRQDGGQVIGRLGYEGDNELLLMQGYTDDLKFGTSDAVRLTIDSDGLVGIGTLNPESLLHLSSQAGIDFIIDADTNNAGGEDQNPRILLRQDGGQVVGRLGYEGDNELLLMQGYTDDLKFGTSDAVRLTIDSDGLVGIGTQTPNANLSVVWNSAIAETGIRIASVGPFTHRIDIGVSSINHHSTIIAPTRFNDDTGNGIEMCEGGGVVGILGGTGASPGGGGALVISGTSGTNIAVDGNDIMARNNGQASDLFLNRNGGDVRIASDDAGILRVVTVGDVSLNTADSGGLIVGSTASANLAMDANEVMARGAGGAPATLHLNADGGDVRISFAAGTGKLITPVIQILGADLAEKFPVSEAVEPGMVVSIDPENPGHLRRSHSAYDRCVAGVVSGAGNLKAGAILGDMPGFEDAPAIALSGRVWVACDVTGGAIAPGDLLTTSDTPGHAMKSTDAGRAHGAVLGKAMTSLDEGRGLVLVLVNLQ